MNLDLADELRVLVVESLSCSVALEESVTRRRGSDENSVAREDRDLNGVMSYAGRSS